MSLTKDKLDHIRAVAEVNKSWMWTDDVLSLCDELEAMAGEIDQLRLDMEGKAAEISSLKSNLQSTAASLAAEEQSCASLDRLVKDTGSSLNALDRAVQAHHNPGCFASQEKELRICHKCQGQECQTARCEAEPYQGWSLCEKCWATAGPTCVSCAIERDWTTARG